VLQVRIRLLHESGGSREVVPFRAVQVVDKCTFYASKCVNNRDFVPKVLLLQNGISDSIFQKSIRLQMIKKGREEVRQRGSRGAR
jgi:hypothetical protein